MTSARNTNALSITSHSDGDTVPGGSDVGGDITYTWAFPNAAGLYINVLVTNDRTGEANQTRAFINDDGSGEGGTWIAALPWVAGTNLGDDLLLNAALYDPSFTMLDQAEVWLTAGVSPPDGSNGTAGDEPVIGNEPPQGLVDEDALPPTPPARALVTLFEQANPIYTMNLPITPSEIPESASADVKSYRVIGAGTHSFPDGRSEWTFSLSGYWPGLPRYEARLPHIHDWRPPQDLAEQIRVWLNSSAKLRLRASNRAGLIDRSVYVNKYTFTKTGHAGDIKYQIDLTEWRTIRVKVDDGTNATEQLPTGSDADTTDADEAEEPNPVDYTVQSGDTLWDLAKAFLGDSGRWPELYEANKDVIGADPHWIYPGQVFQIPGGTLGTEAQDGFAPSGEWSDVATGVAPVPVLGPQTVSGQRRSTNGRWR